MTWLSVPANNDSLFFPLFFKFRSRNFWLHQGFNKLCGAYRTFQLCFWHFFFRGSCDTQPSLNFLCEALFLVRRVSLLAFFYQVAPSRTCFGHV